jgi:hypothetical protein
MTVAMAASPRESQSWAEQFIATARMAMVARVVVMTFMAWVFKVGSPMQCKLIENSEQLVWVVGARGAEAEARVVEE